MNRSIVLIAIGALSLAGCGPAAEAPPPIVRPVLSVVVAPLESQAMRFVGSIEPQVRTALGFQILGRLLSRTVDVGDLVRQGQGLATIDPIALELAVRSSEASLAGARAELVNATNTEERKRTLRQTGAATQADLESAEQALEAARSSLQRSQSDLLKAREQLGYARLTAGFDGVVTAVSAEVGQVVSPGQSVVTIARPGLRDAIVDIPELIAGDVRIGTPFLIALQLDTSVTVGGTVREIAPLADASTRTRRIRIALDNPGETFRLGSNITAALTTKGPDRILLPASAVLERDGKTKVWIVDPAALTVTTRDASVTRISDNLVEVTSGVSAGDRVVTAGVNSLAEGQRVRILGAQ
ncbi:efflux RND transporter periplasmic adaptor subunit [Phreatobacter aquaticus]|uniref:Efflux RND transporter periplasmic adaptor subunit n=1 Tax=Phreatobacter aquaticus TaxID=2570229 RepID=A0A4D7QIU0_9HYPH|nr:efflux RND transporter periplasmic adaptor subunit [Phreatobacter aquaticus]QCK85659.1 efflux RND transporter periplasmic adaptor subunit [Phreatobacter aquaticus]